MPGLGLVARTIVLVSILASCSTATTGGEVGAAGAAAAPAAVGAAGAAAPPAGPTAAGLPAAVSPATYSPGHLAITLSRAPGSFSSPVLVTNAKDGTGRLFVVEQGGRIRIIDGGSVLSTPFLDIRSKISCCGERGLLGLAFHPSYASNGRFFVDYTDGFGSTVVAEYRRDPNNADRAINAGSTLLHIAQPYANHNGGMLAFGKDGYLYVAMGDGGSAGDPGNRAQNKNSLLGKLLRIDVDHKSGSLRYRVPSTNPFVGKTGDDRIWAYGLRNPWRFSFDRLDGTLWIGDVGQDRYEEIDRVTQASGGGKGRNFGWRVLEGRACYIPASGCSTSGKVAPLAVYTHSNGCAVVGGYVYRGSTYPAMVNAYILGDYCSGKIWAIPANGHTPQAASQILDTSLMISSFGEAEDGSLYLTDVAGGGVYRLVGALK
jgi:glucose/arabinose dehydrogenase